MAKLNYITRVVSGMHYKQLFKTVAEIHNKSKKNSIFIFFDMIWCAFRYGAGYNDYKIFAFYNMKGKNRNTYVTRIRNKKIIMLLNDQKYSNIIDEKNLFDKRFKKYLKRDIIDLDETSLKEFEKFMENKKEVFCKPFNLDSGRGIEKLQKKDFKSLKAMYNYLKSKNLRMIEEVIIQHKDMNKLYPQAINCLRIVTIVIDGKPIIVYAVSKCGTGGHYLDNTGFEGIFAPVDLETGKINALAYSEHTEKTYVVHPDTKVKFEGFQIPYFNEIKQLVYEAALEVPEVKYVGWDVFISPDGPGLIEGNDYPDYAFWQLPVHNKTQIGLMPFYKQKLPKL
ncbi:MAG: sugar-transfer associated ATP-grasp domain-containing protein [Bacilli bacterium]